MHVCYLFMDRWVSSGDREPPGRALVAELWGGLAGIPAATERVRAACCALARSCLPIAKQQRDPVSRGRLVC